MPDNGHEERTHLPHIAAIVPDEDAVRKVVELSTERDDDELPEHEAEAPPTNNECRAGTKRPAPSRASA